MPFVKKENAKPRKVPVKKPPNPIPKREDLDLPEGKCKAYPEDERYYIYEDGRIYSTRTNKFLTPHYDTHTQKARVNIDSSPIAIDKVVTCFKPCINKRKYRYIGHKDGDPMNNHVDNLRWVKKGEPLREFDIPEGYHRTLKDFPHILIYSDGKIFSLITGIFLSQHLRNGYFSICISWHIQTNQRINILVAKAFCINPCPDIYNIVNHIDGNKQNNHYTNLEWCTSSQNSQHYHDIIKSTKPKKEVKVSEEVDMESLYPIPFAEKYFVTEDGKIYSEHVNRYLTPYRNEDKYYQIRISKKIWYLHTIVCKVFHGDRPSNNHVVDHIDGNPENNHKDNLRWVTYSENTKKWAEVNCVRSVRQISLDGEVIAEYKSIRDAEIETGIDNRLISQAASGKIRHTGNFVWQYLDEGDTTKIKQLSERKSLAKKIQQIDIKTLEIIKTYKNIDIIAKKYKVNESAIRTACKKGIGYSCAEYYWKYADDDRPIERKIVSGGKYNPVEQLDYKTKEVIRTYDTVKEASDAMDVTPAAIRAACKKGADYTSAGYSWKFKLKIYVI